MRSTSVVVSASALAFAFASAGSAHAALLGPTPYLSFADSPFSALALPTFHLENFEDGALNTPGVVASGGIVVAPGSFTDSVDADDGVIDGSGSAGSSFYSQNLLSSFRFTFDAGALGGLPTHAGLVWTDVGITTSTTGVGDVTFEAFDAGGISLGLVGPITLGDGTALSQTAEDRFFGATNPAGISAIEIRMGNSTDWEIDHLQYGLPTPGTAALLAAAGLAGLRRRR
ncbi:MAG: hypothetical protein ACKVZJ_01505 [Phycisphaerales bacterium]